MSATNHCSKNKAGGKTLTYILAFSLDDVQGRDVARSGQSRCDAGEWGRAVREGWLVGLLVRLRGAAAALPPSVCTPLQVGLGGVGGP